MKALREGAQHRSRRGELGQTLIEFAFIAPVLLVLVMTILDFGIAMDRKEVLQHAVREGTRTGLVGADVTAIKNEVVNQSQGILAVGDVTVCYVNGLGGTPTPKAGEVGSSVRVSASYNYQFTLGATELLNAFGIAPGGLDISMTPKAEGRMETTLSGVPVCPP